MAVRIRLSRTGKKKKAFYRVVAVESTFPPQGKVIQTLGSYNPHTDPPSAKLDLAAIKEWQKKGAIPSDTVAQILARHDKQKKVASDSSEA